MTAPSPSLWADQVGREKVVMHPARGLDFVPSLIR